MKRIILITAIIAMMVIPCFAERSDYIGSWAMTHRTESGGAMVELFILTDDGVAFYLNGSFTSAEPSFSRQYVGTWRYRSQYSEAHIEYGNNAETDAYRMGEYLMIVSPVGDIAFSRINPYTPPKSEPHETDLSGAPDTMSKIPADKASVVLPDGKYTVGTDLLPGSYAVSINPVDDFVSLIIWDSDNKPLLTPVIHTGDASPVIELKDGYTIDVFNGYAILNQAARP